MLFIEMLPEALFFPLPISEKEFALIVTAPNVSCVGFAPPWISYLTLTFCGELVALALVTCMST